jgi:hypothetical protein
MSHRPERLVQLPLDPDLRAMRPSSGLDGPEGPPNPGRATGPVRSSPHRRACGAHRSGTPATRSGPTRGDVLGDHSPRRIRPGPGRRDQVRRRTVHPGLRGLGNSVGGHEGDERGRGGHGTPEGLERAALRRVGHAGRAGPRTPGRDRQRQLRLRSREVASDHGDDESAGSSKPTECRAWRPPGSKPPESS